MYRLRNSGQAAIFSDIVKKLEHKYPTKFLSLIYALRKYSCNNNRFSISFQRGKLWNEILNEKEKGLEFHTLSKKCINLKLLDIYNEYSYF